MSDLLETLRQEGVDPALLEAVQQYRAAHPLAAELRPRIPSPAFTLPTVAYIWLKKSVDSNRISGS